MTGSDEGRLRAATYNVRACRGTDGRRSEERIARVIAALNVDVIGLQELDRNRRRSGLVDQTRVLADSLGWHGYFHAALQIGDEEYGDAILSRYPMRLRQARELPSVKTRICPESRATIWMEIETPCGTVHVINTHLGVGRRERLMQTELLLGPDWLGRVDPRDPLVLLGDFNSIPGSAPFKSLSRSLRDVRTFLSPPPPLRTYPTRFPFLALDHIFINDRLTATSVAVVRNAETRIASDHYPVVAHLTHSFTLSRPANFQPSDVSSK
jgi:endonuclease/exonuclease/phosphatase family metal-dependent hydrolase